MPIFEYRCTECGHRFEKLIRNSADLPENCPECGKPGLKKLFSSFSPRAGAGGTGSGNLGGGCADGSCSLGGSCPTGTCPTGSCPF